MTSYYAQWLKIGCLGLVILACSIPVSVFSQVPLQSLKSSSTPSNNYVRIFYYREGANARASFMQNLKSIDVLAPQSYAFDNQGKLKGGVNQNILNIAKNNNIKVIPLVTNGNFGQASFKAILENTATQTIAIQELVQEAKKFGYAGWQVDFEQMDITYRDNFSAFIERFGDALRKEGLSSSVAVISQISENPNDYPKNLWHKLIGVYDFKSLASSTDFISMMSYDDPGSKGPIARYSWLKQVITHSLKSIPAEKLSLGIPLYYWKWDDVRGRIVGIGGREGVEITLKNPTAKSWFSTIEQAPFITYVKDNKNYTLWYENAQSIRKKVDLISTYKLHGFSAWAIGLEMSDVHNVFAKQ